MRRAAYAGRCHAGVLGVLAGAATVCLTVDAWLSARVLAGVDAAQQLAPLYPDLGVDGLYVAARALGITALVCSALSVAAGLGAAGRRNRGLAVPGGLTRLHRQLSVLTLALAAAHAALPYASTFPPFGGWPTASIPFAQPYSWGTTATWAESAGIIAFYFMLLLGPSYYLAGRWRGGWAIAHRLALATYLLAVTHTVLLGSDFLTRGAPRVALIGAQVPLLVLLALRFQSRGSRGAARPQTPADSRSASRVITMQVASAGMWLLAGAAMTLAVAGALGAGLGGFPLQGSP